MLSSFDQMKKEIVRAIVPAIGGLMACNSMAVVAQDLFPDAQLELNVFSGGFFVGYAKGTGTLHFKGQDYPFTIAGPMGAMMGMGRTQAVGHVYKLKEPNDLEGRYVVLDAGITIGQGGGPAVLNNAKGVRIYLQNLQQGLSFSAGGGSVVIQLASNTSTTPPAPLATPATTTSTPTTPPATPEDAASSAPSPFQRGSAGTFTSELILDGE